MTQKQLSDSDALALSGTTDAAKGVVYPTLMQASWGAAMYRVIHEWLQLVVSDLRVVEIDGNADAIGVLPGTATFNGTSLTYAGDVDSGGAVDGLTDNATSYIWAYNNAGTLTIGSGAALPSQAVTPHVPLASVVMLSGEITSITDLRGRSMLNTASFADLTTYYKTGGTDVAIADGGTGASTAVAARQNLGAFGNNVVAKSGNYTVVAGDAGDLLDVTTAAGTITISLTAAATLADGFACVIRKADAGAGTVVIDPNGAETINGAATLTLSKQHSFAIVCCTGAAFSALVFNVAAAPTALTDNSTGVASDTIAAATNTAALTDNSAGTANTTIQALPDPADAPVDADALREDLVANLLPALRNNTADLAAQLATQRALNTVFINAIASLAAKNNAMRTALINAGIAV